MSNDEVHGLVDSVPPQTHCGLPTSGRKVTDDPFRVTCKTCRRLMRITGEMPALTGEIPKNRGGRPPTKKRRFW